MTMADNHPSSYTPLNTRDLRLGPSGEAAVPNTPVYLPFPSSPSAGSTALDSAIDTPMYYELTELEPSVQPASNRSKPTIHLLPSKVVQVVLKYLTQDDRQRTHVALSKVWSYGMVHKMTEVIKTMGVADFGEYYRPPRMGMMNRQPQWRPQLTGIELLIEVFEEECKKVESDSGADEVIDEVEDMETLGQRKVTNWLKNLP